jgi:hypothetical protein
VVQAEVQRPAHVGRTHLGDHRAVDELDHRVHDRLAVHDDVDLLRLEAEQVVHLEHLQRLVHQGRRADGDARSHAPVGVLERHLGRDALERARREVAERTAGRRQVHATHAAGSSPRRHW